MQEKPVKDDIKSSGLSREDAQDEDAWRDRIKVATGFAWITAVTLNNASD